MNIFEMSSVLPCSPEALFAYHCNPGAFNRLTPPWETVRVNEADEGITEGYLRHLKVSPLGIPWLAVHEEFMPGRQFVDRQMKGPFRTWRHQHIFLPHGEDKAVLTDRIEYQFPLNLPFARLVEGKLRKMFRFRHRQTERDLQTILAYPGPLTDGSSPLRVGITGAGGLVGRALSSFLRVAGHEVVALHRGYRQSGSGKVVWWPEPDLEALEGFDVVIHLAGENLAQYWSESVRAEIYRSRVEGTKRLSRALAELKKPPSVFISTSATGYYDQTLDVPVDESAPPGEGFLSEVCRDWEGATGPAEAAGIRTCHVRVGLVMSMQGGILPLQVTPFKLGLGPILGDGEQMQSFIDIDDLTGAIYHMISNAHLSGPFNATSPQALSQADFARTLAQKCSAPQWLQLKEKPFRLLLGDQAGLLFEGVEARPSRLLDSGYRFLAADFRDVLKHHLGQTTATNHP